MNRHVLAWAAALGVLVVPAQAIAAENAPHRYPLTVAYFGELATHPGLMVGTERTLWKSGWQETFLGANLGGYQHPGNHGGLFLNGELGYRLTFPSGVSTELSAGAGYLHTRVAGEVYAPAANGQVEAVTDWGRPSFMPSVALGIGYDCSGWKLGPSRLFGRLQGFGQAPYNTYTLMHLATQVGVTWQFK